MIKSSSLICALFVCTLFNSVTYAEKLSQADFDQFITEQTKIVNATKHILDEPDQNADAQSQRQALCQRLTAYQEIQKVSEENQELNMAPTMTMIAKSFLERQAQSMNNSGMTTAVFCKNREV